MRRPRRGQRPLFGHVVAAGQDGVSIARAAAAPRRVAVSTPPSVMRRGDPLAVPRVEPAAALTPRRSRPRRPAPAGAISVVVDLASRSAWCSASVRRSPIIAQALLRHFRARLSGHASSVMAPVGSSPPLPGLPASSARASGRRRSALRQNARRDSGRSGRPCRACRKRVRPFSAVRAAVFAHRQQRAALRQVGGSHSCWAAKKPSTLVV